MTGSPWTYAEESQTLPPGHVTLVSGTTFAICDGAGDIPGRGAEGIFVADTRVCSVARLLIDGAPVEPLAVAAVDASEATFAGRSADGAVFVRRTWSVTAGARCGIELRHRGRADRWVDVQVELESDLADLFAVKEGAVTDLGRPLLPAGPTEVRAEAPDGRRGVVARWTSDGEADPATSDRGLAWRAHLGDDGCWSGAIEVVGTREGQEVAASPASGWKAVRPHPVALVDTDVPGLRLAVDQAIDDLDALRLVDPQHPADLVVAAGAPWFMTLFGRDSLLTSWMALPLDPSMALATVRTLARLQGTRWDAATDEQPGRILHEVRFGRGPSLSLAEADRYFGTADATPLFVMLVHELWRWGVPLTDLEPLLPAVDAATRWLDEAGDPDGDGFVEYERASPDGLANQGWKDSWDAVCFADGELATAPIALAEVQGYAYAAHQAAADLAEAGGDHGRAEGHRARADRLRRAFDDAFWLPDEGWYALALDRDKRPVDALGSHLGHLLWTGIVPPERVDQVAAALTSPPMTTGWGVRTLASTMRRFDALGYHTGSVWPHDTALAVAGLRRAGRARDAARVAGDLLSAAEAAGGRLPELFAGLDQAEFPIPVPYPASCSPQAWASASPLLLVRAVLGLEVDLPRSRITLDPVLPEGCRRLHVSGLQIAGHSVALHVDGDSVAFQGLPHGLVIEVR